MSAGTALVAISDKDSGGSEGTHKLWGDILAVVAAMTYSVYTIMLRKRLPDDDHVDMALFLGYLGLILTFTIGAILWLLIVADAVKVVGWPKGALGWAVVKGLLDNVLSDYLWARAVVLIGPTPATAGLLMQWPISIVADLLLGNANWLRQVWTAVCMLAGAMSVLVGFVGLNVEEITVREWLRGRFTRRVWCG
ncbi:unnamed protein product [Ostreobium quekettii]|uniref:Uncharacterized protein n=1 Tax=Ostreobium quekettii TaxID=121088 RepID=A0A8S1J3Q1_9CHLO|nr:unnamed protein product [Ostreobium quekettii]